MSDSAARPAPIAAEDDLGDLLLEVLPAEGSTMGNASAREALSRAAARPIGEVEYAAVRGWIHPSPTPDRRNNMT